MSPRANRWAIVLAGGSGTRLWPLTGRAGAPVPKQFCSLRGGRSLLGDTLARAERVVPRERTLVVVVEEHRPFFERELARIPGENVVVQPRNRGTAPGILLPLLEILGRDPGATLALFPSDHHVGDERVLQHALERAFSWLGAIQTVTLLGATPDGPETEYGWIVPGPHHGVRAFVEKPPLEEARRLQELGAVWSTFLLVATGTTLLELFRRQLPALHDGLARGGAVRDGLAEAYHRIQPGDFSRQVLEGSERDLRLHVVPPCGWTDLGTPARVARCLEGLAPAAPVREASTWLDLPDLSRRLQEARACHDPVLL